MPAGTVLGPCFEPVLLFVLVVRGDGIGADDLRFFSCKLGEREPSRCVRIPSASDALLARTVPASLRWNQFIIGLLDLRVIFFICDWGWSWVVTSGSGGSLRCCDISFLDLIS